MNDKPTLQEVLECYKYLSDRALGKRYTALGHEWRKENGVPEFFVEYLTCGGYYIVRTFRHWRGTPEQEKRTIWKGDIFADASDFSQRANEKLRNDRELGKVQTRRQASRLLVPGFPKHGGYPSVVGGRRVQKHPRDLSSKPPESGAGDSR